MPSFLSRLDRDAQLVEHLGHSSAPPGTAAHFGVLFYRPVEPASRSYLFRVLSNGYLIAVKTYCVLFPISVCVLVCAMWEDSDLTRMDPVPLKGA